MVPVDQLGWRIAAQYRARRTIRTGGTRHELHAPARGAATVHAAKRRPGRLRAFAYSPSATAETVLLGPR